MATYKISIIGDAGVGKTTFVNRHVTGHFTKKYVATVGFETREYLFKTTRGPITLELRDYAGQEKFGLDNSCAECDGAIVMFSIDSKTSMKNAVHWLSMLKPETNYVLCCTKCDLPKDSRKILLSEMSIQTILISSKSNYEYERPFLELLRKMKKGPRKPLRAMLPCPCCEEDIEAQEKDEEIINEIKKIVENDRTPSEKLTLIRQKLSK